MRRRHVRGSKCGPRRAKMTRVEVRLRWAGPQERSRNERAQDAAEDHPERPSFGRSRARAQSRRVHPLHCAPSMARAPSAADGAARFVEREAKSSAAQSGPRRPTLRCPRAERLEANGRGRSNRGGSAASTARRLQRRRAANPASRRTAQREPRVPPETHGVRYPSGKRCLA